MRIIQLLAAISVIWFAYQSWKDRGNTDVQLAQASSNGFVSAAMPDGAAPNTVVILAPVDCPSDAAQRADALSDQLTRLGIPNIRSSSYSSNISEPTTDQQAAVERAVSVLNGEIPAVFVNGIAKANPTADEVVAEYQSTR